MRTIKVIELFAGVGGFRLGLEGWEGKSASSGYRTPLVSPYKVVWSNQWEPSSKTQHASMVYEHRWGAEGHTSQDIAAVEIPDIPDHDLLVGGFPCQDYSVATTLKNSKGLIGKKGVLWWSIHKILNEKIKKPDYIFLENVDRLLVSPANQRGRDFAIILQSLNQLGYAVEWRVINAADYGMPQRRRRIYILAYKEGSPLYNRMAASNPTDWANNDGVMAHAFPVLSGPQLFPKTIELGEKDLVELSTSFNDRGDIRVFEDTGLMHRGVVYTFKTTPKYLGDATVLADVLLNGEVTDDFFIQPEDLERWKYLKGAKKEVRLNAQGFEYHYSEGAVAFPDPLDKPSRTIITSEGGSTPSRFKHVVQTPRGFRRLSPLELERLNMFPDNHTLLKGITDAKRAFFMGNALVVGVVEKIGVALAAMIEETRKDELTGVNVYTKHCFWLNRSYVREAIYLSEGTN